MNAFTNEVSDFMLNTIKTTTKKGEKEDVEQIPSLGSRDVEDRPVREETGHWADAAQQTTTPASKKAASKKAASKQAAKPMTRLDFKINRNRIIAEMLKGNQLQGADKAFYDQHKQEIETYKKRIEDNKGMFKGHLKSLKKYYNIAE